jgi:ABC-type transport system involved in multi-copper enzyme maturation permease subunit
VVDPERHARWLAPAGAVLVVTGIAIPHAWGFTLLAVGALLLLAACYSKDDGLLLFGPFVRRELLRAVRQTRVLLWRTVLVVIVGVAVGVVYFLAEQGYISRQHVPGIALGAFSFVGWNLCVTFLPLLIQSLSATVTDDREARRLDYLLVTDLRNREILLGKALGRVATYAAYLFAPLPFCVLAPALFGLDPRVLLVPLAYFGLTCLSGVGLSLVSSVYSTTSKKAGANTTYLAGLYVLGTLALLQLDRWPAIWKFPAGSPVTVGAVVEAVSAGNPFPYFQTIPVLVTTGGNPVAILLGTLRGYAAVHVAMFLIGVLLATWKLRPASAALAGAAAPGSAKGDFVPKRPPVWDSAIIWKERYCGEFVPRSRAAYRLAIFMTFLLGVFPALAILGFGFLAPDIYRQQAAEISRLALPFVAWVTFAFTGRLTSGLIARERERDTLVSLLVTPLTYREILRQKFLGGLWNLRGGLYWLLMLGGSAVVAGFYPAWAFALLVVMYGVWSIPLATFGLFGSAAATTTQKAQFPSGLLFVVWILLPLLVCMPIVGATGYLTSPVRFFAAGIAALFGLGVAALAPIEDPANIPFWYLGGLVGAAFHLAVARYFYRLALKRFVRACEGEDRPEKPPVAESARRPDAAAA